MSLSRWPTRPSSLFPVFSEDSGGWQEFCGGDLLSSRWKSLALTMASSIVLSCSAKWHWASSWLDDEEAMARRGEEDSDGREMGSEGQGMDMGALRLSLLGGEEEGLMLNEEPRRERRLPPWSLSFSFERLIQDAITGMLRWRTGPRRCGGNRGGGGRGGGKRGQASAVLVFCLLWFSLFSLLWLYCSLLWKLLSSWSELQSWELFVTESPSPVLVLMLLLWSSSRWTRCCGFGVCSQVSRWWTLMKSGLMKQRAPLDWQQSSSDGVRTRSQAHPGVVAEEIGLWVGGGGLSGAATSDTVTEPGVVFQKPGEDSTQKYFLHHQWMNIWTMLIPPIKENVNNQ